MAFLPRKVTLSSSILHQCGEYLEFSIEVRGEDATITLSAEQRFTFSSHFAGELIHFKAHATRVTKCPECKRPLPRSVSQWNDEDFKQDG